MNGAAGRKACEGVVAAQESRGIRNRGSVVDCILLFLDCGLNWKDMYLVFFSCVCCCWDDLDVEVRAGGLKLS